LGNLENKSNINNKNNENFQNDEKKNKLNTNKSVDILYINEKKKLWKKSLY